MTKKHWLLLAAIYLAESLIPDLTVTPPQVRARWIPASPMLTEWLKGP
jgi:hypothetical protein